MRALIVRPSDVDNALRWLGPGSLIVGSTAGYPDGSTTTGAKLYEGRDLLRRGAREIEMVVNVGKLVSRQFQYVEMELLQMAKSCHESGAPLHGRPAQRSPGRRPADHRHQDRQPRRGGLPEHHAGGRRLSNASFPC